jgi:hypothetical protein
MKGDSDSPFIRLSKPILITSNSSPKIITEFLKNQVKMMCEEFFMDDTPLDLERPPIEKPAIIINYSKINIF